MPAETLPVLLAVLVVSSASLVGAIFLVLRTEQLKRLLPFLVAVAAGALLGDTFLHLLPQAVAHEGGFTDSIAWSVLAGLLGFLLIESTLHWHHHGEDVDDHGPDGVHSFGWMNLLGDFVHNIIDGMLIAGSWLVSTEAGLATTVAVLLHEIPQEFGDFGVLLHAGFTPRRALLLNFATGCSAFLGAVLVLLMHEVLSVESVLVPIAAGGFLYIACADLIPELRKRLSGARLLLSGLALGLGLLLMVGVHEVVPHEHDHGPGSSEAPGASAPGDPHDHSDHDHPDHDPDHDPDK